MIESEKKALEWAERSFKQGHPAGTALWGLYQKREERSMIFSSLDHSDNPEAQCIIGTHYIVYTNDKKIQGQELLTLSAQQNSHTAQLMLGCLHDKEFYYHIKNDQTTALMWYRLSAAQGNANAQFNLGDEYDSGKRVCLLDADGSV